MSTFLLLFSLSAAIYLSMHSRKLVPSLKRKALLYSRLFFLVSVCILLYFSFEYHWAAKSKAFYSAYIAGQETEALSREGNDKNLQTAEGEPLSSSIQLHVPLVEQFPELPRGCEVTSLTMLFKFNGVEMDKLTLADEVKKNPAKLHISKGEVYYGDPNDGFVGDMYTLKNPGLGVYHKPILELAQNYFDERAIDFTGQDFSQLLEYLNQGQPVWVIINSDYKKLKKSYFQTWITPNGKQQITRKEHSVVVTGYDKDSIYFNDPLNRTKKAPIKSFKEAWVQMGKQAITISKP